MNANKPLTSASLHIVLFMLRPCQCCREVLLNYRNSHYNLEHLGLGRKATVDHFEKRKTPPKERAACSIEKAKKQLTLLLGRCEREDGRQAEILDKMAELKRVGRPLPLILYSLPFRDFSRLRLRTYIHSLRALIHFDIYPNMPRPSITHPSFYLDYHCKQLPSLPGSDYFNFEDPRRGLKRHSRRKRRERVATSGLATDDLASLVTNTEQLTVHADDDTACLEPTRTEFPCEALGDLATNRSFTQLRKDVLDSTIPLCACANSNNPSEAPTIRSTYFWQGFPTIPGKPTIRLAFPDLFLDNWDFALSFEGGEHERLANWLTAPGMGTVKARFDKEEMEECLSSSAKGRTHAERGSWSRSDWNLGQVGVTISDETGRIASLETTAELTVRRRILKEEDGDE